MDNKAIPFISKRCSKEFVVVMIAAFTIGASEFENPQSVETIIACSSNQPAVQLWHIVKTYFERC